MLLLVAVGCMPQAASPPPVDATKKPAEVLILGTAKAVRWEDAKWIGEADDFQIELRMASDSYLEIFNGLDAEHLWILACFVPDAERGAAAELLANRNFRGAKNLVAVNLPEGNNSFRYTGGEFPTEVDGQQRSGVFVAIVGSKSLEPAKLAEQRKLQIALRPEWFTVAENPLRLRGPGRLAFKLQRRLDQSQDTISTVIEIDVDFPQ